MMDIDLDRVMTDAVALTEHYLHPLLTPPLHSSKQQEHAHDLRKQVCPQLARYLAEETVSYEASKLILLNTLNNHVVRRDRLQLSKEDVEQYVFQYMTSSGRDFHQWASSFNQGAQSYIITEIQNNLVRYTWAAVEEKAPVPALLYNNTLSREQDEVVHQQFLEKSRSMVREMMVGLIEGQPNDVLELLDIVLTRARDYRQALNEFQNPTLPEASYINEGPFSGGVPRRR